MNANIKTPRMANIFLDANPNTSAILELLIYPVIYVLWRKRSLPKSA